MSSSSSRITASDHGAKLVLAVALMLAYTVLLLVVRLHSRWPWKSSLKREDFLLLGATVGTTDFPLLVSTDETIHSGCKHRVYCSDLY